MFRSRSWTDAGRQFVPAAEQIHVGQRDARTAIRSTDDLVGAKLMTLALHATKPQRVAAEPDGDGDEPAYFAVAVVRMSRFRAASETPKPIPPVVITPSATAKVAGDDRAFRHIERAGRQR